ncbi:DUF3592 domain-containing protein [Novosphingobium sp. B 225]|uniref:DUF3592 domain-containing protein n=1 Tax=Novosphingobium sp. B 225 TaxID=1961849 RepID=UPI000B4B82C1|nr:DUF3592 domain-containing protein [Novosphingobium sp. B 225]
MESFVLYAAMALVLLTLALLLRSDLPRWLGMERRVDAEVIGHHSSVHDNTRSYAPVYRFGAEGRTHEVTDQVYSGREYPPVGTRVTLSYPHGRPDLARVPRPWLWLGVYAVLLYGLAVLIGKATGWLQG